LGQQITAVEPAQLERSDTCDLTLPPLGSIVVTHLHQPDIDLVCLRAGGSDVAHGAIESDCVRFSNLPDGDYFVGPAPQVSLRNYSILASKSPFGVPAEESSVSGSTAAKVSIKNSNSVEVEWNSFWSSADTLNARVEIIGPCPPSLFIAPQDSLVW